MAKINFDKPSRFDAVRAEKGVNHTIIKNGHNYGTFKTSLFDQNTKLTRITLERFQREHGDDEELKSSVAGVAGVYMFVMTCVHDWSGVTSGGKPVPFSKKAAFEYLTMDYEEDNWLSEELMARSSNDAFYKASGDPRATAKDAAGN